MLSDRSGIPLPPPDAGALHAPGCYVRRRVDGFVAHFCASPETLRSLRRLTRDALAGRDVGAEAVESAQLVVSELVGNAVRACGDRVPLVVEVYATSFGLAVNVHDPDPGLLPERAATPLDSAVAEGGRGLGLLDLLAPGWHVRNSAIGKQVRCRVPVRAA
ncbi:hypothetical protein GCM10023347_00880 [Streptomyces chumphonensis]|uniref:ATP-binding protein n=1 Tax=Streptomyces chumphonensis TaxID=1214925 RepID=A0A927IEX9_9ACTN|nr:ATP-binding protein [Streptomyces chumphonensis]MBD3934365.1 ATP-binding protein [Streptomyces chumphonensis]